jgi:dynein heavy chain 2
LADLFHPETFLNALRQKSARKQQVAIDELKLVSSFENGKIDAQNSVKVEGMWLQGCGFDGRRTTDNTAGDSSELFSLPVCYMGWLPQNVSEPYSDDTVITPIYHNLDREKLLTTIKMPNNGDAAKRIIGGVALFLNGSE